VTSSEGRIEELRVLAANEALYVAFNARDLTSMERLWARAVPVACVHPGWAAVHGRENVMATWRAILENPDQPRVVAGAAEAYVRGEAAWVVCRELVTGAPLAATNVFVLEEGEWRIAQHHSSAVAFLAEDLQ
jgi:SnoaL-like domain